MATYPNLTTSTTNVVAKDQLQPFTIANYDGVVLAGVLLPIVTGSLRGGLKLDVEYRKAKGANFKKYVSQGLDTEPVGLTLHLFIDRSQNPPKDWRVPFSSIEDRLIPRPLDARNAISTYHPSLAGRGILQIVPTSLGMLNPVASDRWTVELLALDVRSVSNTQGKATKVVDPQDDLRVTDAKNPSTVESPVGPLKRKTGTGPVRTYPGTLANTGR